jgi:hypothetical protein
MAKTPGASLPSCRPDANHAPKASGLETAASKLAGKLILLALTQC